MKKLLILAFSLFFLSNFASSESSAFIVSNDGFGTVGGSIGGLRLGNNFNNFWNVGGGLGWTGHNLGWGGYNPYWGGHNLSWGGYNPYWGTTNIGWGGYNSYWGGHSLGWNGGFGRGRFYNGSFWY